MSRWPTWTPSKWNWTAATPAGYTLDIHDEHIMLTKIQKWGKSQGLRLSKALLADADMDVGDSVDLAVHKGALVIRPVRRLRGGHSLRDLVRRVSRTDERVDVDWGAPVGREVW
jgi:antitoxin MazE